MVFSVLTSHRKVYSSKKKNGRWHKDEVGACIFPWSRHFQKFHFVFPAAFRGTLPYVKIRVKKD